MEEKVDRAAEGIKVLDFTWYGVGPIATKYLADNGAEVIKVESRAHPDGLRLAPPWKDGIPGINRSQFHGSFNTSKRSVSLNMGTERGRDMVRQMVPHFDIVADSFTAGTMKRWGLDYEHLRELRPDLIQLSTCMQGQTGPNAHYPGFGNLMASLCGFYYIAGYDDEEIAPPYGAYTDFIAQRFAACSLLAALEHRRRTGEGQFIDMSQYEAALHFLAPAVTDYLATGTVVGPRGNASERYAPHGSYRCADVDGHERWIALAVEDDAGWEALLAVLGVAEAPEALATQLGRLRHREQADALVAAAAAERDAADLAASLQEAGVAAYPVQSCLDLVEDDNLGGFEFWQWLDHSECGPMPYDGIAHRLERTPGSQTAAPCIGEHTVEVLGEYLGIGEKEIEDLVAEGVVY